jgi:hypothetical protein
LAAQRENAARVKLVAEKVEKRGSKINAALAELCAEFVDLQGDLRVMRQLGATVTPERMVDLSFRDVVAHSCRSAGIPLGDVIEPGRRRTAADLVAGYAAGAVQWADSLLGEKAEAA